MRQLRCNSKVVSLTEIMTLSPNKIRQLARAFRAGIENCDPDKMIPTMRHFPGGSCGDASLLLARYLRENGAGEFQYVRGARGEGDDWTSHAWLEQAGVIVDITADQFEEINEPVFVTTDVSFHGTFEWDLSHPSDYRDYQMNIVPCLGATYVAILSYIPR